MSYLEFLREYVHLCYTGGLGIFNGVMIVLFLVAGIVFGLWGLLIGWVIGAVVGALVGSFTLWRVEKRANV